MNGRNWYHRICCRPGGCHSQPLSQSEHTDVGRGVTVTPVTRCGNLQRLLLLHKTRPRCTELIRSTFAMLPPPGESTPPPPTSRFQPIGQALAKFAVWSIAARERPVKVHSTKRLKRLERLENISLRIRTWRRLTFRLQAPVGILKPLRKSVLGCSQESRSRNQRGCTWLAISSSSCSASDTRRDSRSTQTVNRRCQVSLENSHSLCRTNWSKTME